MAIPIILQARPQCTRVRVPRLPSGRLDLLMDARSRLRQQIILKDWDRLQAPEFVGYLRVRAIRSRGLVTWSMAAHSIYHSSREA